MVVLSVLKPLRFQLCHVSGVPGTTLIQLPPSHSTFAACRIILCVYSTSNWRESCIECPGLTPWECTISPRKMNTPLSMGWSFNNWSTISQNLSLFSRSRLAKFLAISWSCIVFLNLLQGLCRGLFLNFLYFDLAQQRLFFRLQGSSEIHTFLHSGLQARLANQCIAFSFRRHYSKTRYQAPLLFSPTIQADPSPTNIKIVSWVLTQFPWRWFIQTRNVNAAKNKVLEQRSVYKTSMFSFIILPPHSGCGRYTISKPMTRRMV